MEKKKKFNKLQQAYKRWKGEMFYDKKALANSIVLLLIGLVVLYFASNYTTNVGTVPAQDIVLDNLPVFEWPGLFSYLPFFITTVALVYMIGFSPKRAPYYISLTALFVLTRSVFITLTHLSTPSGAVPVSLPIYFENDVFFSGHTGLPFLCFLMFKKWWAKIFMLISSLAMGFIVLATHRHYSIDVAAAFFITYAIYQLGNKIFLQKEK